MAFKMKGHALKGPYQQQAQTHQLGDIEASGKSGDAEFNQEIDQANAERVKNQRDANVTASEEGVKAAEQAGNDFVAKVNAFTEGGGTMTDDQKKSVTDQGNVLQGNYDDAIDANFAAVDAHNYSADSTNVANQNAANRLESANAAEFDAIFKQTRGDERRRNKAVKKMGKADKAVNKANAYMRDNMTEGTKLDYDEQGNSSVVGSGTYGTSDKKVYRKSQRLSKKANKKIGRANKAVNRANEKAGK